MQNNLNPRLQNKFNRRSEKGFSLLELIIGMLLFSIVTGSIYGVMQAALRSRNVVSQKSQLNKNIRLSLNLVGRDTFNAGYNYPLGNSVKLPDDRISTRLGIPVDVGTDDDDIPPIIVGNNLNANTYAVPNTTTDQVTFLYKDSTFNLVGDPGPPDRRVSQSVSLQTGIVTTGGNRFVLANASALFRVNDILVVTGESNSALGVVTAIDNGDTVRFGNGDSLTFNQSGAGFPMSRLTTAASVQRVKMVTYFVTTDGILTRREYANVLPTQAFVDEPLVYGVENFQAQYILSDGVISDNPSAGPDGIAGNADDTPANLANVRQIRFTVNAKSIELDTRGQPYKLTMSSTYSTRNLGYE